MFHSSPSSPLCWVLSWSAHVGYVDVEDNPGDLSDDQANGLATEPVPMLELWEGKWSRLGLVGLCGAGHHGAVRPPAPLTM